MTVTFLNFIGWLEQRELPCLFKKYFHIDCPGCGFQRGIIALLRGSIKESFLLFPTTFALMLFFGCLFINSNHKFINDKNLLNGGLIFIFSVFISSYLYKII